MFTGGLSSILIQGFSTGFENLNWGLVASVSIFGAVDGAFSVLGMGQIASVFLGGSLSGAQYIVDQAISNEEFNINGFLLSIGTVALAGAFLPRNFDGYQMTGIYNTSNNYLCVLKSVKNCNLSG